MRKTLTIWGLLLGLSGSGCAGGPAGGQVDLSTIDRDMVGPPTQVLVLGSVHLNEMSGEFEHEALEPLIDRLAAFNPQIITIEAIPGEQCDLVARHPAIYNPESWKPICPGTDVAQAATELDVPAAIARLHQTLKDWPATPTPAQRRHLAALFMAAGENNSALVQWLQLPSGEQRAGDGLDDALVDMLKELTVRDSESTLIAARLAARLGLQRVYATNDHTGDSVDVEDVQAYGAAIQQAWDTAVEARQPIMDRREALTKAGDMLALYRHINRPDVLRAVVDTDFGAALQDTSPERYGHIYVAGWEARNLRMVANIRTTFRERPGTRVLSIVGATHKPWFDNLLGQMQGVEIVDVEQILE